MSIRWVRMRLRSGSSPAEVQPLVRKQAAAFQALPYLWDSSAFPSASPEQEPRARALLRRYHESSRALGSHLEIAQLPGPAALPSSMRVSALTRNPMLPPEWRLHAYRSYLPDQLPAQLAWWRSYLQLVRSGNYDAYLGQLYLHEMTVRLFEHWHYLVEQSEAVQLHMQGWERQPELVSVCETIDQLRPPLIHPAPLWLYWRSKQAAADRAVQPAYEQLHRYAATLVELTRRFDRQVPGTWQLRRYQALPSLEEFLKQAQDERLSQLLAWVQACCTSQEGLLLIF